MPLSHWHLRGTLRLSALHCLTACARGSELITRDRSRETGGPGSWLRPNQNSSRVTRRNWTASSSGSTERSTSTRCQKKSPPIVKCSEPV